MGILQAPRVDLIETDDVFVERACAGDPLAFARLVDFHSRDAVATALGLLGGDRGEAEEAVQESFCRAWRSLSSLADRSKFKSWFAGILYRVCRDVLRARGRTRKALGHAPDPGTGAPSEAADEAVQEAMALPDDYREPLVLFYLQNLSVSELAATLGISEANAKVRLHRARRLLRERLQRKGMR